MQPSCRDLKRRHGLVHDLTKNAAVRRYLALIRARVVVLAELGKFMAGVALAGKAVNRSGIAPCLLSGNRRIPIDVGFGVEECREIQGRTRMNDEHILAAMAVRAVLPQHRSVLDRRDLQVLGVFRRQPFSSHSVHIIPEACLSGALALTEDAEEPYIASKFVQSRQAHAESG